MPINSPSLGLFDSSLVLKATAFDEVKKLFPIQQINPRHWNSLHAQDLVQAVAHVVVRSRDPILKFMEKFVCEQGPRPAIPEDPWETLRNSFSGGIFLSQLRGGSGSDSGAIGLSSSTVSRGFVQASAAKLREMQERDLTGEDVVALFLDGKTFAEATMVVALGITLCGEKRFLGFVETDTENAQVLTPFLRSLLERGLDISQGLLVIIDGGKGLQAAVKKAFRKRALIQRCQWHKRENVVSYLSKGEQASWRKRLQWAYNRSEYEEALTALEQLHGELEERNQSAAGSLEEGLEETLTLHRLGVHAVLGRSFKTTNCLESVNALVEERCAKVDHWKNSSQHQRWLATALVDIEPRLRKVVGYRHLPKLREALKRELKTEAKTSTVSKKKVA